MQRAALVVFALALALTAPACLARHMARTVGAGNGEIHAAVGGPFFSNLGAPIPMPNLAVGGRYGVTDGFDVGGDLSLLSLAYGTLFFDVGGVGQLYRDRDFAVALSGHGHFLVGFRGPDLRFYPELGLHLEGLPLRWLVLFGGVSAFAQFDPPPGKPPIFASPYLGAEILFGGSDEAGHPFGVFVEAGWISPWQDSTSVVSWNPTGYGAVTLFLGFRARFGGLDR